MEANKELVLDSMTEIEAAPTQPQRIEYVLDPKEARRPGVMAISPSNFEGNRKERRAQFKRFKAQAKKAAEAKAAKAQREAARQKKVQPLVDQLTSAVAAATAQPQ